VYEGTVNLKMANYQNKHGGYKINVTVCKTSRVLLYWLSVNIYNQAMIYDLIDLNDARAFTPARKVEECKSEM
jgi:hypothetical protein